MKETIKNQRLFFISLIGIITVSLIMATTYAYQTIQIDKKGDTEVVLNIGTMDLSTENITSLNVSNLPLVQNYKETEYIEFTLNNLNSTAEVAYQINLTELVYSANLSNTDFKYTVTEVSGDNETVINTGDFSNLSKTEPYTTTYTLNLYYDNYDFIDAGKDKTLRLYLWLEETIEDQNSLENTSFQGKIQIISTFANTIKNPSFNKFNIYGNTLLTYAEGTTVQSPTCPATLTSLGNKITDINSENYDKYEILITISGKNLFNEDLILSSSLVSKTDKGYSISAYPINYGSTSELVQHLKRVIKPNETYTLSRKVSNYENSSSGTISIRNATGTLVSAPYGDGLKSKTFSLTQEQIDSITNIYIYGHSSNPTLYEYIQLEEGSTVSEYEPYQEPTMLNIYLDEPLRSVGDCDNCSDYIDLKNGNVIRNVETLSLKDGTDLGMMLSGAANSNGYYGFYKYEIDNDTSTSVKSVNALSNLWPYIVQSESTTNKESFFVQRSTSGTALHIRTSLYDSVENLGNLFKTKSLDIQWVLEKPTITKINLPFIKLTEFSNNVLSCTDNICSSKIDIELNEYYNQNDS